MHKNIILKKIQCISTNYDELSSDIMLALMNQKKTIFVHLNMFNFTILTENDDFLSRYSEYSRLYFEGIGMKIAAYILGQSWNNDTNGTDLYPILFNQLEKQELRIYLLGATEVVINNAVTNIKAYFPKIQLSGYSSGFFSEDNESKIVDDINSSGCDLLILGMGMYREADFLFKNYELLNVSAIWCVGGLFDFVSGNLPRAPKAIRKIRLEWLYRFFVEPKAKFKRTFITPLQFFPKIIYHHYTSNIFKEDIGT